jgi:N-acetylglucosamine-6-phosphate deacetylase
MMTRNPARILGLEGRKGLLASGYDADIVIFDDDIKVYKTLIGGRLIYNGN